MTPNESSDQNKPHRRRVRYNGTHPKRFADKYKEHDIAAHPELRQHLQNKGKTPADTHIPILVPEIMESLGASPGQIIADCTIGYGGHATEFARRITPTGKLVGIDIDGTQLERTRLRLAEMCPDIPMAFHRSNFAGIANIMQQEAPEGFDIIFADLGLSSMQIDNPNRGMSYKQDGPLDMRMDDRRKQTAADLLSTLSQEAISDALRDFSDEPDHLAIAQKIVQQRQTQPLTQIAQLVDLIFQVKGLTVSEYKQKQRKKPTGLNPAARTFQAIRMLVNDEQGTLKELLRVLPYCVRPGGRIGIISFHSGEDRLVKKAFASWSHDGQFQPANKLIVPHSKEISANTRSACAKFRWVAKAL
jgi:16S rRNA (cytosine1402-N4)-methyltransferase